jgi:biopolymer transport protein TolR
MESEIKRIYTNRDDHVLYLKADKDLAYEKVVDATDLAAKNGVTVVAMISDQKPGTTSTVAGDTKSAGTAAAPAEGSP